ncbi:MAG: hypothetical protein ACI8S3_000790 [Alphaproteobacteria bacterium]
MDAAPGRIAKHLAKSRPKGGFCHRSGAKTPLFHFLFFEQNVFARSGVVFLQLDLIGHFTRVFLSHVIIAGIGGAHELYEYGTGFSHRLGFL